VALLAMAATLRAQAGLPGGARRTAGEVAAALGAAPRHAWIVRRWLAVLAEEGWLTRDEDGHFHDLRPVSPAQLAAATPTLDDARHALGYPPELTRFFRAAIDRLPQLLRDEVPLQALLFPDGEVTTALGTYQDNVINRYLNAAVAEVLGGTAAGRPAPLRVVELGAGVGGTTATVLAALAGHDVDYLFTDVSRFFLDAARERFGDHPGLRYGLVDINGELPGQGLAAGGTDVVLAANVAHNAHHVRRMLHGLRAVLAPGGRLALIESCREHYQALTSMHFLMSPRPGQPHPGRDDVRTGTDRIFLTRREWLAELHAAGFTQVLDLPRPEDPLAALAQHLFVVANDRKAPV
jgi:SAM-dependent methyltransferase